MEYNRAFPIPDVAAWQRTTVPCLCCLKIDWNDDDPGIDDLVNPNGTALICMVWVGLFASALLADDRDPRAAFVEPVRQTTTDPFAVFFRCEASFPSAHGAILRELRARAGRHWGRMRSRPNRCAAMLQGGAACALVPSFCIPVGDLDTGKCVGQ
eukprot:2345193-Rhodomonas_salina.3